MKRKTKPARCPHCNEILDCAPEAIEIVKLLPVTAICTGCRGVISQPYVAYIDRSHRVPGHGVPVMLRAPTSEEIARVEEIAREFAASNRKLF